MCVTKPSPKQVAKLPWGHGDTYLQYAKRRRSLGWQVWHEGELAGEFGHFDLAWTRFAELAGIVDSAKDCGDVDDCEESES